MSAARIGSVVVGIAACAGALLLALSGPSPSATVAPTQSRPAPEASRSAPRAGEALGPAGQRRTEPRRAGAFRPAPLPAAGPPGPRPRSFDETVLLSAGVSPADARWLRERYQATEGRRSELLAIRQQRKLLRHEREELRELDSALERELSPEDYDDLLAATGQNNRVRVIGIGPGGAAAGAGIQPGDLVLRYDGELVQSVRELVALSERAEPGTLVPVEVLHGDEVRHGSMEAGPLGMGLEPYPGPPLGGR